MKSRQIVNAGLAVLLVVCLQINFASAADRRLPTAWWELVNSDHPEDQALVKQLRPLKWYEACRQWGGGMRAKTRTRRTLALTLPLDQDDLLTPDDMRLVPTQRVDVGMSTCGVIAVLGMPDSNNTTTTAQRTSAQMVYRSRGIYVYTEARKDDANGIVRSIQR
ncbi:MAG TPA: hypothetical protein PLA97_08345 [Rubrivivax sp.]|nr:hypothetical protein [Rubrivivax sp.]